MATQADNLKSMMRAIMSDVRRYHSSKNKEQQIERASELQDSLSRFASWIDDDVALTVPSDDGNIEYLKFES